MIASRQPGAIKIVFAQRKDVFLKWEKRLVIARDFVGSMAARNGPYKPQIPEKNCESGANPGICARIDFGEILGLP